MMDASIERSYGIVAGYHAFEIDWEIRSLGQIHGADGMNVIPTIRTARRTSKALIDVSLGCHVPSVLCENKSEPPHVGVSTRTVSGSMTPVAVTPTVGLISTHPSRSVTKKGR